MSGTVSYSALVLSHLAKCSEHKYLVLGLKRRKREEIGNTERSKFAFTFVSGL